MRHELAVSYFVDTTQFKGKTLKTCFRGSFYLELVKSKLAGSRTGAAQWFAHPHHNIRRFMWWAAVVMRGNFNVAYSQTTEQCYTQDTHTHMNGRLTLVPLEPPNFSSKLHCSFAACTEMEEEEDWQGNNKDNNIKRSRQKERKQSVTEIVTHDFGK